MPANVTYTAAQVQSLFDLLAGACTQEQVKAMVANLEGWNKDCQVDNIKQPELPFMAEALRQGWANFYGEEL